MRNRAAVLDSGHVVNYFRLGRDDRLLFGDDESDTISLLVISTSTCLGHCCENFRSCADVSMTHVWSGTLAITRSRLPFVAQLGQKITSANGFAGHGVALVTLAGKLYRIETAWRR